ncbi:MAG: TolC family protein [Cyclobacteriaceae bacterium]|nr:TolC family protein [Cyclobacteriaceae bacterium]
MMTSKRELILILLLALFALGCMGQQIDYNKIVLPANAQNVSFEEKLVQLAWNNNPESQMAKEGVDLAKGESKVALRSRWSQFMGVSGNLNEFNIKAFTNSDQNQGNLFFPRYNVYVQLPISLLVVTPHEKKVAQARINTAEQRVNLTKLEIRARVLRLYSDYKKAELVWIIRKQSMDDEESSYLLVEQKFKNGDATIEEYTRAQKNRNDQRIQLAFAENEYVKSKINLEEVIGVRLEEVY